MKLKNTKIAFLCPLLALLSVITATYPALAGDVTWKGGQIVEGNVAINSNLVVKGDVDIGSNNSIIGDAVGSGAFAQGMYNTASSVSAHAEGVFSEASAWAAHSEGDGTRASGYASHAQGVATEASGSGTHAGGFYATAKGDYSFAHGRAYVDLNNCHVESIGDGSFAFGYTTGMNLYIQSLGIGSHAEGYIQGSPQLQTARIRAEGNGSFAQGYAYGGESIESKGLASFAQGRKVTAAGDYSQAVGYNNKAAGIASRAIGQGARATNDNTFVWSDGTEVGSTSSNQVTFHAQNGYKFLGGSLQISSNWNARGASGWDVQNPERDSILTVQQLDQRYGQVWFPNGHDSSEGCMLFLHPDQVVNGVPEYTVPTNPSGQQVLIKIPEWAEAGLTVSDVFGAPQNSIMPTGYELMFEAVGMVKIGKWTGDTWDNLIWHHYDSTTDTHSWRKGASSNMTGVAYFYPGDVFYVGNRSASNLTLRMEGLLKGSDLTNVVKSDQDNVLNGDLSVSGSVTLTNNWKQRSSYGWLASEPATDSVLTVADLDRRYGQVLSPDSLQIAYTHPDYVSNGVPHYTVLPKSERYYTVIKIPAWTTPGVTLGDVLGTGPALQFPAGTSTTDTPSVMTWNAPGGPVRDWCYVHSVAGYWVNTADIGPDYSSSVKYNPGDIIFISNPTTNSITIHLDNLTRTYASADHPQGVAFKGPVIIEAFGDLSMGSFTNRP